VGSGGEADRNASAGGVGRGRQAQGKGAAEQSSTSDEDAAESSAEDYAPPSRGGKSRRVDEPRAAGQRSVERSDSEQSERGAGPSDDEEEEEEEEGEFSSPAIIERKSLFNSASCQRAPHGEVSP